MKQIYLLLLCSFYTVFAAAQRYTRQTTFQTVVQERKIYLNGSARGALGGKQCVVIPVRLPEGTRSWYYSFYTSADTNGTRSLNLLLQLSSLMADHTGISKALLSNIKVPAGSMSIDAYLLDQYNTQSFINLSRFTYWPEGSVTNTRQDVVPVSGVTRDLVFIGLKNPGMWNGIVVTLEVVAAVSANVYEDVWTPGNIDIMYNNCLRRFLVQDAAAAQVCNCVKDKLSTTVTPSGLQQLSVADQNRYYERYIAACSAETGNEGLANKNARIKEVEELLRGQITTSDYEGQEKSYSELIGLGVSTWEVYNGLGYCQLCLRKYEEARRNLTIGLGKQPEELFLLGNLGDYYLLTGQYERAMDIFLKHKNKRLNDRRRFKNAVADDLKEFERLGISHPNFAKAKEELGVK